MPVSMSGEQFRAFMDSDDWGPDSCWEEVLMHLYGIEVPEDQDWSELVAPSTRVTVTGGWYIPDQSDIKVQPLDFEAFAQRWLDRQEFATLTLRFPREYEARVRSLLRTDLPTVEIV